MKAKNPIKNINIKKLWPVELTKYLRVFIEKIIVYKNRFEIIYKFEDNEDNKKTNDLPKKDKSLVTGMLNMEVPSGFEPLYTVLQTAVWPLYHGTKFN